MVEKKEKYGSNLPILIATICTSIKYSSTWNGKVGVVN